MSKQFHTIPHASEIVIGSTFIAHFEIDCRLASLCRLQLRQKSIADMAGRMSAVTTSIVTHWNCL